MSSTYVKILRNSDEVDRSLMKMRNRRGLKMSPCERPPSIGSTYVEHLIIKL